MAMAGTTVMVITDIKSNPLALGFENQEYTGSKDTRKSKDM